MNEPEVLAVIPARAGSKRIPGKNLRHVGGRPMICWTVEAALLSAWVTRVVVTTDSAGIAQEAQKLGAEVINRPPKLAGDKISATEAVLHVLKHLWGTENYKSHGVVQLLPTSPLRTTFHVDAAVSYWWQRDQWASVISVTGVHNAKIRHETAAGWLAPTPPPGYHGAVVRGDWTQVPRCWVSNGAIQITEPTTLKAYGTFHQPKSLPFEMDALAGLDIDNEPDLQLADAILRTR